MNEKRGKRRHETKKKILKEGDKVTNDDKDS